MDSGPSTKGTFGGVILDGIRYTPEEWRHYELMEKINVIIAELAAIKEKVNGT